MKNINSYVVTALQRSKGYRVTLSQRLGKSACKSLQTQMEAQNEIAIPANVFFTEFKIEKRTPEYIY